MQQGHGPRDKRCGQGCAGLARYAALIVRDQDQFTWCHKVVVHQTIASLASPATGHQAGSARLVIEVGHRLAVSLHRADDQEIGVGGEVPGYVLGLHRTVIAGREDKKLIGRDLGHIIEAEHIVPAWRKGVGSLAQ